jgi:TIR domain
VSVPVLAVYVVWHPDCQQGEEYKDAIFATLCTDPDVPASRGPGVPVRFRTSLSAEETAVPVCFGRAGHTVVFVLADDALVASPAWYEYADELAGEAGPGDAVIPVAITAPANLPPGLGARQAIRLNGTSAAEREARLLSDVVHDICQVLDPGMEKVRVFLSHAKADGLRITTAIRRYLDEVRLDDFFDTADIPDGTRFAEFLTAQAGSLPALLAVQTDSYASREWCRLEVLEAKRRGVPIVVLSALQNREGRSFPYLGNVPVVRWRGKGSLPVAVGALLGEVLRDRYFPKRAEGIRMHHGLGPEWRVLTHPPELMTLLAARESPRTADGAQARYLYPDPPLGTEELRLLHLLEPGLHLATPTVLQAQ